LQGKAARVDKKINDGYGVWLDCGFMIKDGGW